MVYIKQSGSTPSKCADEIRDPLIVDNQIKNETEKKNNNKKNNNNKKTIHYIFTIKVKRWNVTIIISQGDCFCTFFHLNSQNSKPKYNMVYLYWHKMT